MDAHVLREIEIGVERRLREERERSAQIREERERPAQAAATPRRAGPPAPGTATTPASEQRKRLHSVMQNLWEETEMTMAQAYGDYQEAIVEVEAAIDRDPRGARPLLRAADEAKKAWERAREDLDHFRSDLRFNLPQPGPEAIERASRANLRNWGQGT